MLNNFNRAKQFLPMNSLKGFTEALRLKEKTVEERKNLLADAAEELSFNLSLLQVNMLVVIKYYHLTSYQTIKGLITKINYSYKYLVVDDQKIFFNDIINIIIC